jgi:hypothetical protein
MARLNNQRKSEKIITVKPTQTNIFCLLLIKKYLSQISLFFISLSSKFHGQVFYPDEKPNSTHEHVRHA